MGNACSCDSDQAAKNKPPVRGDVHDEDIACEDWAEQPAKDVLEPRLALTIIGARGLRKSNYVLGKLECLCVIKSRNKTLFSTQVSQDKLEPVWIESVAVNNYTEGEPLQFFIYGSDESDLLGKAVLKSEQFEDGFNGELELDGTENKGFLRLKIKVAGKNAPVAPPSQFEFTVEKGEHKAWGISVDVQDEKTIRLASVDPGPFRDYNVTAKQAWRLVPSDYITSVNGVTEPASKMVSALNDETKVTLAVQRDLVLTVVLERQDGTAPLGVEFPTKRIHACGSLVIVNIVNGVVKDFNDKTQDSNMKIHVGDRIISVAGFQGDAADLRRHFEKATGRFQVAVSRPAPSGHWRFFP